MPCNLNQLELSQHVCDGVAAAGGVPLPFNTIAVCDNQSQGTPGMRASLVSREVIADSIELMTHAHDFDALVCLVGCDKTVPAALMALARLDKPAVVLYSGPMRAGPRQRHDPGRLGGGRRRGARPDRARRARRSWSSSPAPGAGTCAGHFTANTMAVALDCLGIAVAGDGLVAGGRPGAKARGRATRGRAGRRLALGPPRARSSTGARC